MTIAEREARMVTPHGSTASDASWTTNVWAESYNVRAEVADIAEAPGLDYALTIRVVDELRKDGQLTAVDVAGEHRIHVCSASNRQRRPVASLA